MSSKAIVLDANILVRAVPGKRVPEWISENLAGARLCHGDGLSGVDGGC